MMIQFESSDKRDAVEDQLFWMYKTTYEIEMHINAVLSLDNILAQMKWHSDQSMDMIFYHNELALFRTAFILKNKPDKHEKHSLCRLKEYLEGQRVKTASKEIEIILNKISLFYTENQTDINKLINKRDAEAHEFKLNRQIIVSTSNNINYNRHLEIIYIARILITQVHFFLFEQDFPDELKYDVNIYDKIYRNGIL